MKKENLNRVVTETVTEDKEFVCPTCGHGLVPVWTLPREKIRFLQDVEIREQYYCELCNARYAIEEIWSNAIR